LVEHWDVVRGLRGRALLDLELGPLVLITHS
jgi:hypothetical protein